MKIDVESYPRRRPPIRLKQSRRRMQVYEKLLSPNLACISHLVECIRGSIATLNEGDNGTATVCNGSTALKYCTVLGIPIIKQVLKMVMFEVRKGVLFLCPLVLFFPQV